MIPTAPLLAAFVSPALFAGGAAAVAAPILIHLLARRRFRRIRWAAMDFLVDAERRNRRRLRMEEWILLALRCLCVLLLAAMVARPFLQASGLVMSWAGTRRTERVFVLDDSLSMAYQTPDGPVFNRVRQAVRRLLASIREHAPDDTVTILRMSDPASPVDSGTYLDDTQTEELLARLEALEPTQRSIEPTRVMEDVVATLDRSPGLTNAAVYIISDFQRRDWAEGTSERVAPDTPEDSGSPGGAPSETGVGVLAPLAEWAGEERSLHVVLISVGEADAANLAITDLSATGGQIVAGTTGTMRVRVANYTARPQRDLALSLTTGNLAQPPEVLRELGPGRTADADLEVDFLRAGFEAVRVEIPPDALPADNVRYAAPQVAGAIRILIVDGEPAPERFDDEVTLLATALRPEGDVFSGNEVVVADEAQLDGTALERFQVVVLANVYRVSDPTVESLERFVQRGGGLLVFLGDQVDPDLYNAALYRRGEGLLPAELTEVLRADDGVRLSVADRSHRAMRGLDREGDPLGLGQIPFFSYFGCRPFQPESARPDGPQDEIVAAGNLPTRRAARVVARFDAPGSMEGDPAIVERPFGEGRVVLVTTTADKEWHHWPDHPTFLPVIMELTRHVARPADRGLSRHVGDVIELPLDGDVFEPDAVIRTPAYPNERETGVTAVMTDDGRGLRLRWEATDRPGIYRFLVKRREGGESALLSAVNTDPREGDLTMADEAQLRRALGDIPFEYVDGIDALTEVGGDARVELWRLFLFSTVAMLMTEQVLAWWWGRRR
jgi:hypothetical protein